jgi:DNA-binding transcriptional regulator LsrR (DeoR family)
MSQVPYRQSGERRAVELAHKGRSVEDVLRGYNDLGWTQGRIAEELHVTRQTVIAWFKEFSITPARRAA